MAKILKVLQLGHQNHVAEMQIRGRRIESCFDSERTPRSQLLNQFCLNEEFYTSSLNDGKTIFGTRGKAKLVQAVGYPWGLGKVSASLRSPRADLPSETISRTCVRPSP